MNGLAPIVDPELADVLNGQFQSIFSSLNCHQFGTIVSFDPSNQTASISINFQRVVYNQQSPSVQLSNQPIPTQPNIYNYPVLIQCPVFVMTGGGSYISMPVKAGDTCLVLFNDRDMDSWFLTGAIAPPNSSRMHSLSDGMAIVGFRSLANAISGYSSTNVRIHSDDKILMDNATTSLRTTLQLAADALTKLNASQNASAEIAAFIAANNALNA